MWLNLSDLNLESLHMKAKYAKCVVIFLKLINNLSEFAAMF